MKEIPPLDKMEIDVIFLKEDGGNSAAPPTMEELREVSLYCFWAGATNKTGRCTLCGPHYEVNTKIHQALQLSYYEEELAHVRSEKHRENVLLEKLGGRQQ